MALAMINRSLLFCAMLACLPARAADTVTWLLPDFAPAGLPVNGQPTNGVADATALYIGAHWPEAEHRYRFANAKRIWADIGSGGKFCHAAALITQDRKQIAYFTPTNLAPPLQLIVREATLAQLPLNGDGDVQLARLLAMPGLRGILAEKRSFGEAIDGIVAERASGGLSVVPPSSFGGSILKMLAGGQVDYTIEYDFALSYQQSQNPALRALRAVGIEGANTLMPVGVACPRNAWGKAAILRIDRILSSREGAAAVRAAGDNWATPGVRERYRKAIDAFTAKRMQPTPPGEF